MMEGLEYKEEPIVEDRGYPLKAVHEPSKYVQSSTNPVKPITAGIDSTTTKPPRKAQIIYPNEEIRRLFKGCRNIFDEAEAFTVATQKVVAPIDIAVTASMSTDCSGNISASGSSGDELWKVKLDGKMLGSISYSTDEADTYVNYANVVDSNATSMLKFMQLNNRADEDDHSSTDTDEVSNSGRACSEVNSSTALKTPCSTAAFQMKLRRRLANSAQRHPSRSELLEPIVQTALTQSFEETSNRIQPTLSISPFEEDFLPPIEVESHTTKLEFKVTSVSEDDVEFKNMMTLTDNYQRSFKSQTRQDSAEVSAVSLSGMGIGMRNKYTNEQKQQVPTPSEAANASCSLSSIVDGWFGGGNLTPKKSTFGIIVSITYTV